MGSTTAAAIDDWREKLLDLSKRNRLIQCGQSRTGLVTLERPQMAALWEAMVTSGTKLSFPWRSDLLPPTHDQEQVAETESEEPDADAQPRERIKEVSNAKEFEAALTSPRLTSDHILTRLTDKALARRLQRLSLNSQTSLSEQGVNTLFVAFGILKWFESNDSDVPLFSPLLLIPVALTRASPDSLWELSTPDEEVVRNHCLEQILQEQFAVTLPVVDEDKFFELDAPLARFLQAVRQQIDSHPKWTVLEEVVIGNFAFQKLAMWNDLEVNRDKIADHPICKALAGESDQELIGDGDPPSASELDDRVHPKDAFHIRSCDSSQHEAIEAVKSGMSLVLDGPPGTGKSQTIANVIAEFLAQGKKVLFVSEKAAALEVVKRRLDEANLGDFCLECHSHKANKKQVIAELGRCLALQPETYDSQSQSLEDLKRERQRLNSYVRALHRRSGAMNVTPYVIHGRLSQLVDQPLSRCPIPDALTIDNPTLNEMREAVVAMKDFAVVIDSGGPHPWLGSTVTARSLTLIPDIQHHFARLAECLAASHDDAIALAEARFVGPNPSLNMVERAISFLNELLAWTPIPRSWFQGGLRATANKYTALDADAKEFIRLRESLSAYADAAIDAPLPDWAARLTQVGPLLGTLPVKLGTGVRSLSGSLNELLPAIDHAKEAVSALRSVTAEVLQRLKVVLSAEPSVNDLEKLLKVAELVGQLGLIDASWFNPMQRAELKEIAERGKQESIALATQRAALRERFTSRAFETEHIAPLEQCRKYSSFFSRLRPSWRACRSALASLFEHEAPKKAGVLIGDAQRLLEHLRRGERLLNVGKSHQTVLRATALGTVDWDGVLADLRRLDELDALIKVPQRLKQAIVEQTGREDLAQLAENLRRQRDVTADRLAAVGPSFDGVPGQSWAPPLLTTGMAQIAEWLSVTRERLVEVNVLLAEINSVIRYGQDVPLKDLPANTSTLLNVKRIRDRLRDLNSTLDSKIGEPERSDWRKEAELARSAARFAETFGDEPDPFLIDAVCDPEVRSRLTAVVSSLQKRFDDEFRESFRFLESLFPAHENVSSGIVLSQATMDSLAGWLRDRVADAERISEWINFRACRDEMQRLGLSIFLSELTNRSIPLDHAEEAFLARFFRLWLNAAYAEDRSLASFSADEHERLIGRFRELDLAHIENNYKRIRAQCLQAATRPGNLSYDLPASSERGILLREANKKKRHLPLRILFKRASGLLQQIKPCLMMSPLAVSTYLDSPDIRFDLVIFDEASQVRPHDAVCAIYRGRQLLVAGDQKQLPPTNFFERQDAVSDDAEDEDGDQQDLSEFESILDVCATLRIPRKRLQWHYRSRRESLIAFSNLHFYDGELVTFPSSREGDGSGGVRLEYVANGRWRSGAAGGFNAIEAVRTAELVFDHLRAGSKLSLGVITMNQRQQLLVTEELDKLRRERPEFEWFFDTGRDEPFFIKNLENVQGDERDVIILSVGYAHDEKGTPISMRFGPLNVQGGERRLNVAITRARFGLVVISSIRASDIDLGRVTSIGPRLLRAYLDYAERGTEALISEVTDDGARDADSPFEIEVARELKAHGLQVRHQVGCGRFRIDLALVDPKQAGRYVLGVECDGATYHSSATARDRDRLRQSVLEDLGWRICRVWSTDWVQDRKRQIAKVVAAYESSLREPPTDDLISLPLQSKSRPQSAPEQHIAPAPSSNGTRANTANLLRFSRIEDVPFSELEAAIRRVLEAGGATAEDELIVHVARQLGFQRTGSRINDRISWVIRNLHSRSVLTLDSEGRVRIHLPNP